jgi:hypothetical protein
MCSDAAFPNWPYTTLLASRVGNCTPSDRPFALHLPTHLHSTCPLICIRLGQSFASDWAKERMAVAFSLSRCVASTVCPVMLIQQSGV